MYRHDDRVSPWADTAYGVLQAINTYEHHEGTVRGADRSERNMLRAVYGRTDWVHTLAADPAAPTFEQVLAWGRPMTLDLSYHATSDAGSQTQTLTQIREALTKAYPPVGPIWA
jgi:hypothetical protein